MIKSISYWSMNGGLEGACPVETALAAAKQAGFQGLELCIAETGVLTPATDETTCKAYRAAAQQHGLVLETLASGMSWGCSPTHPDAAIRRKAIDLHAAALQLLVELGHLVLLAIADFNQSTLFAHRTRIGVGQSLDLGQKRRVTILHPLKQMPRIGEDAFFRIKKTESAGRPALAHGRIRTPAPD